MKYVYIENGVAMQVIPEFDGDFPNIPVTERYSAEFLKKCVTADDSDEVEQNFAYDARSETFIMSENYAEVQIAAKIDELNALVEKHKDDLPVEQLRQIEEISGVFSTGTLKKGG